MVKSLCNVMDIRRSGDKYLVNGKEAIGTETVFLLSKVSAADHNNSASSTANWVLNTIVLSCGAGGGEVQGYLFTAPGY